MFRLSRSRFNYLFIEFKIWIFQSNWPFQGSSYVKHIYNLLTISIILNHVRVVAVPSLMILAPLTTKHVKRLNTTSMARDSICIPLLVSSTVYRVVSSLKYCLPYLWPPAKCANQIQNSVVSTTTSLGRTIIRRRQVCNSMESQNLSQNGNRCESVCNPLSHGRIEHVQGNVVAHKWQWKIGKCKYGVPQKSTRSHTQLVSSARRVVTVRSRNRVGWCLKTSYHFEVFVRVPSCERVGKYVMNLKIILLMWWSLLGVVDKDILDLYRYRLYMYYILT